MFSPIQIRFIPRYLRAISILIIVAGWGTFGPLAAQNQGPNWAQNLRHVPRYLGPNALPVGEAMDARADTAAWLRLLGQYHRHPGDATANLLTTLHLPLFSERLSLRLHMVPYERFWLGRSTINQRRLKDTTREGSAVGDLNVATLITLWKETNWRPAVQLMINLRTASGGNLEQARFIDAPGYTFRVNAGKTFPVISPGLASLRLYLNAGLRVWQTRHPRLFQNDALVHATGLEWKGKDWSLRTELAGYIGYFERGDKPVVLRLTGRYRLSKVLHLTVQWQEGNVDYPFRSASAGLRWTFL
ncbi:MAG: hypothetical protein RI842_06655 [Schleiferiaceae bacterium]|nr:hypothetical protein [Schleiferiaceae bacterium]